MATTQLAEVLKHIHRMADGAGRQDSDAELLERFIAQGDETAFAVLVRRHGPLVWHVCRGVLVCEQDAEDVFQATFFVLARKAGSIRKKRSLASWLYGVARRIAHKVKASRREPATLQETAAMTERTPLDESATRELHQLLEAEVQRLPDRYRAVVLLCYWQGRSNEQAAQQLGWPVGTVKTRLAKARQLLRRRLTQRGVTLSTAAIAVFLSENTADAIVPATILCATVRGAATFARHLPTAAGISQAAVVLAEEFLRRAVPRLLVLAAVLTITFVSISAVLLASFRLPGEGDGKKERVAKVAVVEKDQGEEKAPAVAEKDAALPAGAIARVGSLRWRHEGEARAVAFAPDGKTLAALSINDGRIYFFETITGKVLDYIVPPKGPDLATAFRRAFATLAYSPDGKFFATQNGERTIHIWQPNTKKLLRTLKLGDSRPSDILQIRFSPNGKLLAASHGHELVLWDVARGKPAVTIKGHNHGNPPLAFSPDGKILARAASKPRVQLWDVRTGCLLRGFNPDHPANAVLFPAFSPDGKTLATGGRNRIILSDVMTGKELKRFAAKKQWVADLQFTPDGKSLISAGEDGKVRIWDLRTGKTRFVFDGRGGLGRSMALSPDGKTVALGTVYNIVRLWDVATGKEKFTHPVSHDAPVHAVAYSPDGKQFVTCGENRQIHFWNAASGVHIQQFKGHNASSVSFSPDGRRLATAWMSGKQARVWDIAQADETIVLEHKSRAPLVMFAPDNKTVVSVSFKYLNNNKPPISTTVHVWDTRSGQPLRKVKLNDLYPESLALSPDGTWAAVGGGFNTGFPLRLCDLRRGQQRRQLMESGNVVSVAFSPDGRLLASGSVYLPARVWEVATGREIMKLIGYKGRVSATAFSPDGRLLATANNGSEADVRMGKGRQTIIFWDVSTGKELHRFGGFASDVTSLAFSPDGKRLVAGLHNGTALIWDVAAKVKPAPLAARKHSEKELAALWKELAGGDARTAYDAVWAFAASPDQSVAFLQKHLHPAQKINVKKVRQWIADLDSNNFSVRSRASRQLTLLGEDVEPELRRALKNRPTLEMSLRIQGILDSLAASPPANKCRELRAVWALELIATPAARGVLADLAKGVPNARLTREAKASLQRLAK